MTEVPHPFADTASDLLVVKSDRNFHGGIPSFATAFEIHKDSKLDTTGIGVFARIDFKAGDPLMLDGTEESFKVNDGYTGFGIPLQMPTDASIKEFAAKYNNRKSIAERVNIKLVAYQDGVNVWHANRDLAKGTELASFYGFSYWLKQLWYKFSRVSPAVRNIISTAILEYISVIPASRPLFQRIIAPES